MFRAHGRLVPVWDLPGASPAADEWEAPLADFAKRYADALADTGPLTPPPAAPARAWSAASSPCAVIWRRARRGRTEPCPGS